MALLFCKMKLEAAIPLLSAAAARRLSSAAAYTASFTGGPKIAPTLNITRINLHNQILTLIGENKLDEADRFVRHTVFSDCNHRPKIFTLNAVLHAHLRHKRYIHLVRLYRFLTQFSVSPNLLTHNILLESLCDQRRPGAALQCFFRIFKDGAPVSPSPTTYRILAKGLVDNGNLELAVQLKEHMLTKATFPPDLVVYGILIRGFPKSDSPASFLEELQGKLAGANEDMDTVRGLVDGAVKIYEREEREREDLGGDGDGVC